MAAMDQEVHGCIGRIEPGHRQLFDRLHLLIQAASGLVLQDPRQ
jgi:hypothetical protein